MRLKAAVGVPQVLGAGRWYQASVTSLLGTDAASLDPARTVGSVRPVLCGLIEVALGVVTDCPALVACIAVWGMETRLARVCVTAW